MGAPALRHFRNLKSLSRYTLLWHSCLFLPGVSPQISKCTLSSAVYNWVLVWMRTKVSHCVNSWSPQV
jgi:hypothetical protein